MIAYVPQDSHIFNFNKSSTPRDLCGSTKNRFMHSINEISDFSDDSNTCVSNNYIKNNTYDSITDIKNIIYGKYSSNNNTMDRDYSK